MLWDKDIRFHTVKLLEEVCPRDHILEELPLGRTGVRADLVKVSENALVGYEIKSDADTLVRLGGQIKGYNAILDLSYLVTTEKYFMESAMLVPDYWGIMVAYELNGSVTIMEHRTARTHGLVEDRRRLELLWRDDLLAALEQNGVSRGNSRKAKAELVDVLCDVCTTDEIASMVASKLLTRGRRRYDFSQK